MLVVLLPIFVADTKITFIYNFVAPLKDHCMLNYFDPKLNTEVICDASPYGLSAILTQCCEDDNKQRLVAYASRSLTETDQKYSQNKREALAILFGYSRFQVCLFGKTF